MRHVLRALLLVPLLLCAASNSRGQDQSVFGFARAPSTEKAVPADKRASLLPDLSSGAELKVRPNAGTELYLWVRNPTENEDTFLVELTGASGAINVRAQVTAPPNTWVPVPLPKAAPPAPPAPAAAPPAPPAPGAPAPPPAPAAEPPPPGIELPLNKKLTLRLLDRDGKDVLADKGKGRPYAADFALSIMQPGDYVVPGGTAEGKLARGITEVTLSAKQSSTEAYPGSAAVQLVFPPQPALRGALIRDGFYRRSLEFVKELTPGEEPVVNLKGRIEGASSGLLVYVGVDGIDRAFKYKLGAPDIEGKVQLTRSFESAVRVARVSPTQPVITAPTGKYPVRIEVDNPAPGDTLEVQLRPFGAGDAFTERVKLDNTREEHAWLETAGPGGGLLFTTRSRDWVKDLDLTHLQGRVQIDVALLDRNGKEKVSTPPTAPLHLIVDGTPPERIAFLPLPNPLKLEKGKQLTLVARVEDPETDVARAVFFLARELDEGKMPADAITAVGRKLPRFSVFGYETEQWAGDLKIPDDFRGPGVVGVVFTNQAGVSNPFPEVQRIEIVDAVPRPALGTIEGKVVFGGRPQPGVAISLRDPDGKDKGGTTTDAKGTFVLKSVAPGNYTVVAAKADSSTGASGAAPATVEADKVTPVTIELSKNRL
jgi:hypothetical protein